ncbi:MAG: hypothetical protein AAFR66_14985 [Bacteroidota bacterium]
MKLLLRLAALLLVAFIVAVHSPENTANQKEVELLEYVKNYAPTRMREFEDFTKSKHAIPAERRAGIYYRALWELKKTITVNPESLADKSNPLSH